MYTDKKMRDVLSEKHFSSVFNVFLIGVSSIIRLGFGYLQGKCPRP